MSSPPRSAGDLLSRYRAVLHAAWSLRHELMGPQRMADEVAFLPAALSLQETPPHPAPRRAALAVCVLFVIALTWACVGQVDIVAVASGRIMVNERTKTLQPLETSIVKRVLVKDGDRVHAGQVLVELDATNASADRNSVAEELSAAISAERRAAALIQALELRQPPALVPASSAESSLLQAEWQDIAAQLVRLSAARARRQAEIATVQQVIVKLDATLPIARLRESDFKNLAEQGFVPGHANQDRARERVEQERELAIQQAKLVEARAALAESRDAQAAFSAETLRVLSDRRAQAALKRQQLAQERNKAEQRARLTRLLAPVAGTVQQVAIHTAGGVVTPAQVLMVIVPSNAEVTAEVVIDNKDIGFVDAGQVAAIKLETFPFTRYGTVPARVRSVTADAVNDEKRGAIFPAILTLSQASIQVDGKRIALSPGMNLTAEIKTGRRRVIEYLLSPVQVAFDQSLKER